MADFMQMTMNGQMGAIGATGAGGGGGNPNPSHYAASVLTGINFKDVKDPFGVPDAKGPFTAIDPKEHVQAFNSAKGPTKWQQAWKNGAPQGSQNPTGPSVDGATPQAGFSGIDFAGVSFPSGETVAPSSSWAAIASARNNSDHGAALA